jgi:hypothetical protein
MRTKTEMLERVQSLVDRGAVAVRTLDGVRLDELDEFECAEDLFGDMTDALDLAVDRCCSAQPTGHRTWSSSEDWGEYMMHDGNDYILD